MEVRPGYKQTEVGVIPEDWRSSCMGDEADLLTGFPFPSSGFTKSGIRLLRGSNVKRGVLDWSPDITQHWPAIEAKTQVYELRTDDLVIAMDGALVGRSFTTITASDLPALLVQRVARLRSKKVVQGLLRAWVASDFFVRHVDVVKTHTAIPHISPKDIREFALVVPSDEAEQHAIAAALSDVDALLGGLDRLIAKKRDLKLAAMQQLLTGQTRLPGFHGEWEISTVGREFEIQLGKMLDAEKNVGVPKPFIGNKAVQWDGIDISELPTVPMTRSDIERFRLKKGDLLVCEGGEVGRAAIWEAPVEECYYQKALHRLRPLRGFNPRLMAALLRLWSDSSLLSNYVTQTSIAHLPREKFMEVPLPVPLPPEQSAIVAVLSDMDAELAALEARRHKTRDLKQAMMQELLTGRTRLI